MLTPDRYEPQAGPAIAVQAAVEVAGAIEALPAVATIDWCDRAAMGLSRLARSGVALVVITEVDGSGRLGAPEATGIAAWHNAPERARGVRVQPALVRDGPADVALVDAVRARAERLTQIGWTPEGLASPSGGVLGSLPGGRSWRAGPVGRMWGELAPADVLVGLAPIGDGEHGRVVLVQIAPTAPALPEADDAVVLRAVLPLLARRALLALGPTRTSPGHWLTTREQAVLDRLISGRTVKQIAEEQGRSIHTIHDSVKSLHRKLSASSRGELIARALGYFGGDPGHPPGPPTGTGSQIEAAPGTGQAPAHGDRSPRERGPRLGSQQVAPRGLPLAKSA